MTNDYIDALLEISKLQREAITRHHHRRLQMANNNLKTAIDQLGIVKVQIAELELRETELKKILELQGAGAYEGDVFRATVSFSERETLDMKAVRNKLSAQFIRSHTKCAKVTSVRVVARTGAGLKEIA
jgi:hypothetical protein